MYLSVQCIYFKMMLFSKESNGVICMQATALGTTAKRIFPEGTRHILDW